MRRVTKVLFGLGVVLVIAILVFPIYWMLITAVTPSAEIRNYPPTFIPDDPQWEIFARVVSERPVLLWLFNSVLAAVGSTALAMSVSVFAGYALSRYTMRGGTTLGSFILVSKMLPATLLVIPLFVMFRSVGLIGSLWSVILAHASLTTPFATWMLKGYFDSIPRELEQAAMVDGCSATRALFQVVLPVAAPGLAATALYGFILSWSDYVYAQTFLTNSQGAWTANLGLASLKGEYVTDWNEIMAVSLLVAIPVLIVYLFLERYLVSGLTAGAEK
ncbi:MAG: carbohydrate ABC transporter permease [Devosia sp.]